MNNTENKLHEGKKKPWEVYMKRMQLNFLTREIWVWRDRRDTVLLVGTKKDPLTNIYWFTLTIFLGLSHCVVLSFFSLVYVSQKREWEEISLPKRITFVGLKRESGKGKERISEQQNLVFISIHSLPTHFMSLCSPNYVLSNNTYGCHFTTKIFHVKWKHVLRNHASTASASCCCREMQMLHLWYSMSVSSEVDHWPHL